MSGAYTARLMRRDGRRLWLGVLGAAVLMSACQGPRIPPHPKLDRVWRHYVELSDERALVVAGDPRRTWVSGSAGGALTSSQAEESAEAECKRRRVLRRIPGRCRTYALGDRILWEDH